MPAAIGPYRIEAEIGRGATSVVYRARDARSGRSVALKTIALSRDLSGGALAEAHARFLREAAAARRMQHPGIVAVLDAGEDGGVAYLAMEVLAGSDLQRRVLPGELLPAPQVLRIAARVAEALAHAHAHGIVHRDIKPGNVIFDPTSDRVVVTDFGVARIADASHTRTGVMLGTPAYMSPELLAGLRADGRSDLYALGVLLFQMLCGRLPFEADSLAALMKRIASLQAPDLRSLRPEMPATLAALLAGLLAKDPAARPADGAAVAHALRAIAAQLDAGPQAAAAAAPDAG